MLRLVHESRLALLMRLLALFSPEVGAPIKAVIWALNQNSLLARRPFLLPRYSVLDILINVLAERGLVEAVVEPRALVLLTAPGFLLALADISVVRHSTLVAGLAMSKVRHVLWVTAHLLRRQVLALIVIAGWRRGKEGRLVHILLLLIVILLLVHGLEVHVGAVVQEKLSASHVLEVVMSLGLRVHHPLLVLVDAWRQGGKEVLRKNMAGI